MRRYIAMFFALAVLLAGSVAFAKNTGNEVYDNAPNLKGNVDAFFDYFKTWEGFQQLPDYMDERTPYEDRLAAEEEAIGLDFADLYNLQAPMVDAFSQLVDKNVNAYNKNADLDDMLFLIFLPAYSMELAMGASLTEKNDWNMVASGLTQAFGMWGSTDVSVTRNAAHDYMVSYVDEGKKVVSYFRAKPNEGIQMRSYTEGELTELFEFRCLPNQEYVWQTQNERILIGWNEEQVTKGYYSSLPSDGEYYGEQDLIFDAELVFDASWVLERNEFHTRVICDGETMTVATHNDFWGDGYAELSPVVR